MTNGAPLSYPDLPRSTALERIPLVGAFVALLIAAIVLVGWMTDTPSLQTVFVSAVTVKPNTAIGLALGAIALITLAANPRRRTSTLPIALIASIAMAVLPALTLFEYASQPVPGIDALFIPGDSAEFNTENPGRMAALTAFCLTLLSGGLIAATFRRVRGVRIAQLPALAAAMLALTALLAYAYGAIPTAGLGRGIQIAIPTAVGIVLLGLGVLAIDAKGGWLGILTSSDAGGTLARQLLPFAFAIPLFLGAFRSIGHWVAPFSIATQTAVIAVLTMLAFGFVVWRTAVLVDLADRRRKLAEHERLQLVRQEETARARADAEHVSRGVAEKALKTAESAATEKAEALALLEVVLSTAPFGFALFDLGGRFIRLNQMLTGDGAPLAAHIGQKPEAVIPDIAPAIDDGLRDVLETGRPRLNVPLVRSVTSSGNGDGHERHLLASFFPIRSDAEVPFAVGLVLVDTTNIKMLEAQLTQSQKMEAIGQLAGGIAHDFNNLMTVITVYSSLLLEDPAVQTDHRADIEEIRNAADRASGLTRQLLAFSRKQVMQPRSMNINDVVTGVDRMLRRLIGADLELTTSLDPQAPSIYADPGQMEQVIINLVVNARDAMPDGGRISVSTARVQLGGENEERRTGTPAGSYVMLAVSDTGTGMSADVRKKLFEPFFTTKPQGQGTGLGLSTVYGIVKQFKGDIRVYSEEGQGSVFKLYFPALDAAADLAEQGSPKAAVTGGGETILLVEDDPTLILLSARILGRLGYNVVLARNGAEALETAWSKKTRIDLVITDVVMPEMGGHTLVERLIAQDPAVRVLFMSGYTQDEVTRRGIFEGQTPFLQKPFTPDQLGRKVREVLEHPTPGKLRESA